MKFAKPPISVEAQVKLLLSRGISIPGHPPVISPTSTTIGSYGVPWRLANPAVLEGPVMSFLRYKHVAFVGCGEARTASVWEMMRFAELTTSYGLGEVHS
jgi:hypothetical protein